MIQEARRHVAELQALLGSVDPDTVAGEAAVALVELGTSIERIGASLVALYAAPAVAASGWHSAGFKSPSHWLAHATDVDPASAVTTLDVSGALAALPDTKAAVASGELSSTQVRVICSAAAVAPTAEADLLEAAGELDVSRLRRLGSYVRQMAFSDTPEAHAESFAKRYLRIWSEGGGVFRISGRFDEHDGVLIASAVKNRAQFCQVEAADQGKESQESAEAYAADALVAICGEDWRAARPGRLEGGRTTKTDAIVHVSLEALRRGSLEDGEVCEVPGIGPVSPSTAEHLLSDAFVRIVVGDGVDVRSVTSVGRTIPTAVRTALEARDRACVVPHCLVSCSLEADHWRVPYSVCGTSELDNLALLCRRHHKMKTYDGWTLAGGPGRWEWIAPPGARCPAPPP
ncbi:MAG: HNH endonuclease signature motif containing protein [Acidimicrobiales bacterium]